MRYTFFWILIIGFIGSFWSCEKDNWEKEYDERQKEQSAASKYSIIFSNTTWISVIGKDSIRINFGILPDTIPADRGIHITEYEIDMNMSKQRKYKYYTNGYMYGDKLKFSSYSDTKGVTYPFVLKDEKLILYNFINNQDYTFYREIYKGSEGLSKNILKGKWSITMNTDSVALVFENGMMKEYVYEKTSGKIIKYTDYEKYDLFRDVYTWQGRTRSVDKIWLYNNNKVVNISKYTLSGDKLTIYKNSNPIVYTKQKP